MLPLLHSTPLDTHLQLHLYVLSTSKQHKHIKFLCISLVCLLSDHLVLQVPSAFELFYEVMQTIEGFQCVLFSTSHANSACFLHLAAFTLAAISPCNKGNHGTVLGGNMICELENCIVCLCPLTWLDMLQG